MPSTRRDFLKLGIAATGAGILVAGYPLLLERYRIVVNTYRLPLPNLPPAFEGLRLVHLTDIHHGFLTPLDLVAWVVDKANSLHPDVIVCTGDYVLERRGTGEIDRVWSVLGRLRAPLGVYSVLGNHDHWADTTRSLERLAESGQDIRHRARALERDGSRIWLAGAGDLWEDDLGIDAALQGLPADECRLVLAHNPDSADQDFVARVDLMIAGHTHGGQVWLPFLDPWVPNLRNQRYVSGFVNDGRVPVFISRGIGCSGLPVRFNCPPEIAVLELTGGRTAACDPS